MLLLVVYLVCRWLSSLVHRTCAYRWSRRSLSTSAVACRFDRNSASSISSFDPVLSLPDTLQTLPPSIVSEQSRGYWFYRLLLKSSAIDAKAVSKAFLLCEQLNCSNILYRNFLVYLLCYLRIELGEMLAYLRHFIIAQFKTILTSQGFISQTMIIVIVNCNCNCKK